MAWVTQVLLPDKLSRAGMDPLSTRLLQAFDASGAKELDPRALAESFGVGVEVLQAEAARLVGNGWLRPGTRPNCYSRTEDGRLAIVGPLDVTLYSRPGCHLCEEAKAQIAPLLREFGARLREVDIETDTLLRERYTHDVPVIFLGPRKVAKHRVDLRRFRLQLLQARTTSSAVPTMRA